MSDNFDRVLVSIAKHLNGLHTDWLLTGDSALKVWGVKIKPQEVNLLFDDNSSAVKFPQGIEKIKYCGEFFPVMPLENELKNIKKISASHSVIKAVEKRLIEIQNEDELGTVQMDIGYQSRSKLKKVVSTLVPPDLLYYSKEIFYQGKVNFWLVYFIFC